MDPANADGPRRTMAWIGPAGAAPQAAPDQAPARSMRWMPNPGVAPTASDRAAGTPVATPAKRGPAHHHGELIADRYRLDQPLREGPLTQTWQATDLERARAVAIEFGREQILDAARALGRLGHPHLVGCGDFGRLPAGTPYVVLELVVGESVGQLLARRGCVAWARAVHIVEQVGAALMAAHEQGVIHGDLHTGNVLLIDAGDAGESGGELVKVLDFGHARAAEDATPAFMSPEQCRGALPDPRSDVYAVGCLLHALITGDPPFTGDPKQLRWRQINEAPKSLGERAPRQFIPAELEAVALRCLDKLPARRYADLRELMAALSDVSNFAAAAAGVARDAHSGARPMGYAGRSAPRDPRELTNGYKPVAQTIIDDEPDPDPVPEPPASKPRAPSFAAVGAMVLGSVLAIGGVGFGGWWLVTRLIAEPPTTATEQAEQASIPDPPPSPRPRPASAEPPVSAPAAALDGPDPAEPAEAVGATQGTTPPVEDERATTKPDKAAPAEPKPKPKPKPEPEPEAEPKPSVKPDSKANEGIAHEDLLDPWD
ncbi:Serine/threonine protein kinase [Enhygromyxa salina]|uniref:Serine/threonine protein kinase n=1 Tax=Enhygromyxa salina TaxID=215803 RepID=A0A0C2CXZ4_9BACT|nr:serine/threonine-protein kinase [Enhygromyxa salina]KIG15876.1 Serine/threonine protein kinase [Enhygromyxa salina]